MPLEIVCPWVPPAFAGFVQVFALPPTVSENVGAGGDGQLEVATGEMRMSKRNLDSYTA